MTATRQSHHTLTGTFDSERRLAATPAPLIDQTVAYTLIRSSRQLHFDEPAARLGGAILVLLLRLHKALPGPRGTGRCGRVVLMGLGPRFTTDEATTTWGPEPTFWIELPPSMMGESAWRCSPIADQHLGRLALAMNRAAHRRSPESRSLSSGPSLPPTMIALPPAPAPGPSPSPGRSSGLEPVITPYVERMAKLYRVTPQAVWPILAEELVVPAERSTLNTPLIDARLCDASTARSSLGGYLWLGRCLGRAVYNPARRIDYLNVAEPDEAIRQMRRTLYPDIAAGCSDDDLRHALERPDMPLFLSKVSKIATFRLTDAACMNSIAELYGPSQHVRIPLRRTATRPASARLIQCGHDAFAV